ncbi:sugar ABC transporter ATP-binding protein [Paraburkholderia monticola]|uniref:Sugar ABC transporter ATP-binding protein n=1 Tax=Paraburkholderia monticola TaxID=1399968 RepID=A0A149Q0S7_9BURK|nr:ABC transporter ATP-binding protein [Paraburkholderia monticola]KXU90931.1 sugar ABC transporter ATP-binding protein [Paraburkholderia monticola]
MSSNDIAITVQGVSKRFELYDKPSDRLKQFILPRLNRLTGKPPRDYFREFWALKDVSFDVRRGEAFAIVGRNGSGKSTLLQIITGTLSPTTGLVNTNGRVAALLELGSGFNPEFTGKENVFLNGALLGFSREEIEQKYDAIVGFADIGQHIDQPVKSYSSGMVVRLAIAVQTQVEPDILIVDEALAVGDALFQKRCYRQIEKLLNNGTTLLFVSHDQEIVRTLTQRAVFLNAGNAQKCGDTSDVLFAYREFLQQQEEAAFLDLQQRSQTILKAHSPQKSYGSREVEIQKVEVFDGRGSPQSVFYAGDEITLAVECVCNVDIDNLNVAFRIVSKEGIKVTTWGTLNEDMVRFESAPETAFWSRKFAKGDRFTVRFSGRCTLGANLYEVQAVVAREHDQYYGNQQVLHWVDDAGHFTVILKNKEYVFDGVCDLELRSELNVRVQHAEAQST